MQRFRRLSVARAISSALLIALSAPTACSSGSDNHPPAVATGGGGGSDNVEAGAVAGSTINGGSGAAQAGAADASSGGQGTDAGGQMPIYESDAGPGRPDPGPAACGEMALWAGATKLGGVSTQGDSTLLSVTPDELDIAFLRAGALYVAHRAAASGTFGAGDAVSLPSGWSATRGAALSADGKRLVLVSAEQDTLGELTRSARDGTFSNSIDQTAFATVNLAAVYTANIFASPVLSPDDQELFFNSAVTGGASTVVAAIRAGVGQVWSSATRLSSALDGSDTTRRLPTGVSADERTLFYFNEESMKQEARWRDEPLIESPLYDLVDLGTRRGAQPNSACDRLYSDSAGDIVVEHD